MKYCRRHSRARSEAWVGERDDGSEADTEACQFRQVPMKSKNIALIVCADGGCWVDILMVYEPVRRFWTFFGEFPWLLDSAWRFVDKRGVAGGRSGPGIIVIINL